MVFIADAQVTGTRPLGASQTGRFQKYHAKIRL